MKFEFKSSSLEIILEPYGSSSEMIPFSRYIGRANLLKEGSFLANMTEPKIQATPPIVTVSGASIYLQECLLNDFQKVPCP
jgi:hypothetical protein